MLFNYFNSKTHANDLNQCYTDCTVFDPDSYNNMSDEKEEEYRKIHDEYKGLVDFMLASFMEDLEVSPEQVEEACRTREKSTASQSESQVTKVCESYM